MNTFKYINNAENTTWQSFGVTDKTLQKYSLEIDPSWKSNLNGNPSAILIEATHEGFEQNKEFKYKYLWANFSTSEEEYEFKGINLDEDVRDIIMFQPYSEDESKIFINHSIQQNKDKIKIEISRDYDGIIIFKLTPIMSYGPLNHLSKTINIDQSKIASGEILLSKWSYSINKYLDKTITKTPGKSIKTEEITTITNSDQKSDNNSQTIESKQIVTKTSVQDEEPEQILNYKYSMNFIYGFDSYAFEKQLWTDTRYIKFYNMDDININHSQFVNKRPQSIIEYIAKNPTLYPPEHVEQIPVNLLTGGTTTLNYNLNTSECKLRYGNCYLVIIQVQSYVEKDGNKTYFDYYDYRYLFASSTFNEMFGQVDDYNTIYLPIIPQMTVNFPDNRITQTYKKKQNDKYEIVSINDIEENVVWMDDKKQKNEITFTYNLTVNNNPSSLTFEYVGEHFYTQCNLNNEKNQNVDEFKNLKINYSYFDFTDYNNNLIKSNTTTNYTKTENENNSEITKTYTFNINLDTPYDSINISAIKTNLLNIRTEVNKPGLFLSEAKGLSNTMMLEDDSIFLVGIHNDGDDHGDEEWYGEIGSASEGYTHTMSERVYDDSYSANAVNEIELQEYYDQDFEYNYFLRHGSFIKQFGLDKGDESEVLQDYLSSNEADSYITSNLTYKSIVPTLFITSGYQGEKSRKVHNGIVFDKDNYYGVSQRADGNTTEDKDLDDEEHNNFNAEYPYWFLQHTYLHPYSMPQVLGTFLIKYATNKRARNYVCTNNYFALYDLIINGQSKRGNAVYLEDIEYYGYKSKNGYHYQPNIQIKSSNKNVRQITTKVNGQSVNDNWVNHYSIGDLVATQLAQFGTISNYSDPMEYTGSIYGLSDENRSLLKSSQKDIISQTITYEIDIQDERNIIYKQLNEGLFFNNVNLNDWFKKLNSKNLIINIPEETGLKFTHQEQLELDPLKTIIPDLNQKSYMLEISPYGDVQFKSTIESSTQLLVWNDSTKAYEIYDDKNGIELYKYGKFSKFIGNDSSLDGLNPKNYNKLNKDGDIGYLENFIKFHPYTQSNLINPKHKIQMPLCYTKDGGFYTTSNKNRNSTAKFRFAELSGSRWYLSGGKTLKGLSSAPKCQYNANQVDIYIDSTQRI